MLRAIAHLKRTGAVALAAVLFSLVAPAADDQKTAATPANAAQTAPAAERTVPVPATQNDGQKDNAPAIAVDKTGQGTAAAKTPPSLHSAINAAARDYAESLEMKSTRPGEDPPFTITVGGEIRIRANYWSNMPGHTRGGRSQNNGMEMRTRVSVTAENPRNGVTLHVDADEHGFGNDPVQRGRRGE